MPEIGIQNARTVFGHNIVPIRDDFYTISRWAEQRWAEQRWAEQRWAEVVPAEQRWAEVVPQSAYERSKKVFLSKNHMSRF